MTSPSAVYQSLAIAAITMTLGLALAAVLCRRLEPSNRLIESARRWEKHCSAQRVSFEDSARSLANAREPFRTELAGAVAERLRWLAAEDDIARCTTQFDVAAFGRCFDRDDYVCMVELLEAAGRRR